MVPDHVSTPEDAWQAWSGWTDLPLVQEPTGEVVVVSAHPDDEILALGGLLQRLSELDTQVRFVVATDGEASHPGSPTCSPAALATRRGRELVNAFETVGLGAAEVVRLRLPDSGLEGCEGDLASLLRPLVAGAGVVLCPWEQDAHPDHDAVGRAVRSVTSPGAGVWEYPVWAWHWASPDDTVLPWARARRFRLDANRRAVKDRAIEAFVSQVCPLSDHPADAAVLPAQVLAHFRRDVEIVLVS